MMPSNRTLPPANSPRKDVSSGPRLPSGHGRSLTNRLMAELSDVLMANNPEISAFPDEENLFRWKAKIIGGKDCVYEGLSYRLILTFPEKYPYEPPTVKFETPCFHPNVDEHGNICLDILKEKWTALYDARTLLLSLQCLLAAPNVESPLNARAAELWQNQIDYKRVLLAKYKKDVTDKQS